MWQIAGRFFSNFAKLYLFDFLLGEQVCPQNFVGIFLDKVVLVLGQSVLTKRDGFPSYFLNLIKITEQKLSQPLSCVDDPSLIFYVSGAYNF
jgi:hypothetical protein